MKAIVVLLLVLAFVSGVVVGERRMMRVHDEQVQVLRAQVQSWKAHWLDDVPVASLMTADWSIDDAYKLLSAAGRAIGLSSAPGWHHLADPGHIGVPTVRARIQRNGCGGLVRAHLELLQLAGPGI